MTPEENYRGLGAWLGNYVAPPLVIPRDTEIIGGEWNSYGVFGSFNPDPPKEDDTDEHEPFTEVTEGE